MSGTFPLLVLILGTATAFPYPPNHGGLMRVMKKNTSQNPGESGAAGYPLQDNTLNYLKTRPAKNPSCWFQYYTKPSRSSRISCLAEALKPLSAGGRDSWQPAVKRLVAKLELLKHILSNQLKAFSLQQWESFLFVVEDILNHGTDSDQGLLINKYIFLFLAKVSRHNFAIKGLTNIPIYLSWNKCHKIQNT